MEGQVVAGGADRLGQHTRRQTGGTGDDERAHDTEAMLLTESRERGEGLSFVHDWINISTILEL